LKRRRSKVEREAGMDTGIEIWVHDTSGTHKHLNLPYDDPFFMGWRTVEPPGKPFVMSGINYSCAEKMTWVQETKLGDKMSMAAMQVSTFCYDDEGNFDKRMADEKIQEIFEVPIQQVTEDFYARKE
jgi:hypothetical protein